MADVAWLTEAPAFRTGSNVSVDGQWRWVRSAAPACCRTDANGEWYGYRCGCLLGHDGDHVQVSDAFLDEHVRLERMPSA